MPLLTRSVPKYRLHKASGQAVVTLAGRDRYLGPFGSPESKREYDRLVAEWLASNRLCPPPAVDGASSSLTVDELILRYWRFAEGHYVRDGKPTPDLANIRDAVRPLRTLYAGSPVAEFRPSSLKTILRAMADDGLCRTTINHRVGKIRRMFRWGVESEIVSPAVYQALMAVAGLRRGKGSVRETAPVRPIPIEDVEAVLPFLTAPIVGLVKIQLLTGMRPGEAVGMRADEIDRSGEVWIFRPSHHKTEDHGRVRALPIGPKAQDVLRPFLETTGCGGYLFNPKSAVQDRNERRKAARVTPMTPSQRARRRKCAPSRVAGPCYSRNAYRSAIWRACDKAFVHPPLGSLDSQDLTEAQTVELKTWRKAHRWHPNCLRHTAATMIRARFGLEASHAVLGHAKADVTHVYAERDLAKAGEVMSAIG